MMTIIAVLLVVGGLAFMTYAGARDGAFFSVYALSRNFIGFLFAMTFSRPTAMLLERVIADEHPWPAYFVAISFAAIFGVVFALARWLKIKYTFPSVDCPAAVDRVAGALAGLLNAFVVTGTVLILWALLPFARYIPADFGRVNIKNPLLDTGTMMLRFYAFTTERMPGNTPFLLEDEEIVEDVNSNGRADGGEAFYDLNGNGEWDRGWLWKYKHQADILPRHLDPLNLQPAPEE